MAAEERRRLISVVIPCFNEELVLPYLRDALTEILKPLSVRFEVEVILVDDGSRDGTWKIIQDYARADTRIKGVSLSRNFGHQAALSCGYDWAAGDAVIALDADLQDPPQVLQEMIQKWEEGADIVFAVRQSREGETLFKRATASLFYRIIAALGAPHVRQDVGDFRLMSRRSLEALRKLPEYHRFIRGMVGWIGFKTAEVRYARKPRKAGQSKYPVGKMLNFAIDAIVSFSIAPLRLAYVSAALLSLAIFSYLAVVMVRFLFFGGTVVPGWVSLILEIAAFGMMILVCLGIMGEYIGRIYEQSKNRPLYLINESSSPRPDPQPGAVPESPRPADPPSSGRPS